MKTIYNKRWYAIDPKYPSVRHLLGRGCWCYGEMPEATEVTHYDKFIDIHLHITKNLLPFGFGSFFQSGNTLFTKTRYIQMSSLSAFNPIKYTAHNFHGLALRVEYEQIKHPRIDDCQKELSIDEYCELLKDKGVYNTCTNCHLK